MRDYSSLRNYVEKQKQWYIAKYKEFDWHWYDEGLVLAIQDYRSSCEFTEDDIKFLEENKFASEDFEDGDYSLEGVSVVITIDEQELRKLGCTKTPDKEWVTDAIHQLIADSKGK